MVGVGRDLCGSSSPTETFSAVILFSAPCEVMARSWLLGEHGAARPKPFPAPHFHGHLLLSRRSAQLGCFYPSPELVLTRRRTTQCWWLPPLLRPPPSPRLRGQGIAHRASPSLGVGCRSRAGCQGHMSKAKPKGPGSGPVSPRRGTSRVSAV